MAGKKKISIKDKVNVDKVIQQARDTVKILDTLSREGAAKAQEQLKGSLRKVGLATAAEVEELRERIEALESKLGITSTATRTQSTATANGNLNS